MCSLFDRNQREKRIQVYILSMGIKKENKEKLQAVAQQYQREVFFIEMEGLEGKIPFPVDTGRFDVSTLGRLFIGEVLPQKIKRMIYLDCDTVIAGSLRPMWRTRLEGNVAGGVQEPTIYREVKEDIGLNADMPYFNAGALIIDLERWRREETGKRMMAFYEARNGKLFANDQDVINHVLRGKIKTIPPKYNFFPNYRYFTYKGLIKMSPSYRLVSKEEFQKAKCHPAVIHYMGDERPWKAGNLNHYRRAYELYLAKTPWKGAKKDKGQEIYMLAYHAMDYVTWLCPPVRLLISRAYIWHRKKEGKGI